MRYNALLNAQIIHRDATTIGAIHNAIATLHLCLTL
jgi:hypothetical protein